MKKVVFLMLLCISVSAMAQEPYKVFCRLSSTGKPVSNKVFITIDYGQKTKYLSQGDDQYLVDEYGDDLEFNSTIDALNYMSKLGWEFVKNYTAGNGTVYWLLSKTVTSDEEITAGFMTYGDYKKAKKKK